MPNKNQNETQVNQDLPGSIRTMKDDLELSKLSPEERLAQSGNFVDAAEISTTPEEPQTFDTSEKPFVTEDSIPTDTQPEADSVQSLKSSMIAEDEEVPTSGQGSRGPQTFTMEDLGMGISDEDSPKSFAGGILNVDKETDSSSKADSAPEFTIEDAGEEEIPDLPDVPETDTAEPIAVTKQSKPVTPAPEVSPVKNLKQKLSAMPSASKSMDMKSEPKKPSYTGLSLDDEMPLQPEDSGEPSSEDTSETPKVRTRKKRKKTSSPTKAAILLLLLITAGATFLTFQDGTIILPGLGGGSNVATNPTPDPIVDPIEDPVEDPILVGVRPIRPVSSTSVIIDTAAIRSDILAELSGTTESLVEVTLKDQTGTDLSFEDVADAMGLVVPGSITDEILDSWMYVYNQEGIYKIAAAVQLNEGVDAPALVQSWSTSIPRDMTGFSLSSISRGVTTPEIRSAEVELDGTPATNYFYNYGEPTNSIDVASTGEYILFGSSQETMGELISLFDIN